MYANVYGYEGVIKAIRLLRNELIQDGWNLGIGALDDLEPSLVRMIHVPKERCNG
jgi:L-lactate dehydrogenase (cytochrome)